MFAFPTSVIKECWSCMDRKDSLFCLVPYSQDSEESVFQSICITPDDYPTMEKNLYWFVSMVCSPRSLFEENDLVQQCDHHNLPFAYSTQRFNFSDGVVNSCCYAVVRFVLFIYGNMRHVFCRIKIDLLNSHTSFHTQSRLKYFLILEA
jgi:hypothetical protein